MNAVDCGTQTAGVTGTAAETEKTAAVPGDSQSSHLVHTQKQNPGAGSGEEISSHKNRSESTVAGGVQSESQEKRQMQEGIGDKENDKKGALTSFTTATSFSAENNTDSSVDFQKGVDSQSSIGMHRDQGLHEPPILGDSSDMGRVSVQRRRAALGAVDLPSAVPAEVFKRPEVFGTITSLSEPRNFEVTILRHAILITGAEKTHMRRIASTHSLTRYEFTNPNVGYMFRCPMASCRFGTLNQRNGKQAARAHFREFHKDGATYHIKIESRVGFTHLTFPDPTGGEKKGAYTRHKGKGREEREMQLLPQRESKGGKKGKKSTTPRPDEVPRAFVEQGCVSGGNIPRNTGVEPPLRNQESAEESSGFQFNRAEFEAEASARRVREKEMYHATLLEED